MAYKTFKTNASREFAAKDALKALDGLGVSLLTNHDKDTFWYAEEGLDTRYKQEEAKAGDYFWDGNNGDKHQVIAVDAENSRLAYRNCDQCKELVQIAVW
jgi:hypothetical protein